MSQRGSAPRPASHRSPKTSPEAAFSSPRSSPSSPQTGTRRGDGPPAPTHDPGAASNAVTDDGGRWEPSGARTSDVHGILNTSEYNPRHSNNTTSFPGQAAEEEQSRSAMGDPGQSAGAFYSYVFQGQQNLVTPQPMYPPLAPSSAPGLPTSSVERGSPTIGPPLPPLGVPRRMLTPRSPRVTSFSRAARRTEEARQNPLPRQPSLPGSASSQDVSPRSGQTTLGPPALRGPQSLAQGGALPPPTLSPVAPRSLSQPIPGHALPPAMATEYSHSSGRAPLLGPGRTPYPPQPPLGRDVPTAGPLGETRWSSSTGGYGSLGGVSWARGMPMGESQHLLTITPQFGEEIVVPVDTHQGSKTQDQKRQKNAIASARFRTRKKEREHQLEVDNHELAVRVRELEGERDFYRRERNRLRDIVSRTPNISEWANGPPSPVSHRSQGNFQTEGGPMAGASHGQGGSVTDQSMSGGSPVRRRRGPTTRSPSLGGVSYSAESGIMAGAPRRQGHAPAHPPPYSYGPPEPSMAEPPARRRRIEHDPQFTTPSYGPLQPNTLLPPAAAPAPPYGLNPPRHFPASPGIARLPPLRMDQTSPTSEHPPQLQPGSGPGAPPLPQQAQQPPPHQPTYPTPYNRPSYDPGWSSAPQGPQDGGQR
jgi:hypothetical protein